MSTTVHTRPEGYHHTWDDAPHVIWAAVPVEDLRIGDFLAGGALGISGIAAAEHRGESALRFDVENFDSGGKGRIILTAGQRVGDVKRYTAAPGSVPRSPGNPSRRRQSVRERVNAGELGVGALIAEAKAEEDDAAVLAAARAWAADDERYEDDEQKLFAFLCAGVQAYSRLLLTVDGHTDLGGGRLREENRLTLDAIAENVVDG